MTIKKILIIATISICSLSVKAQTGADSAAVLRAANDYIEGFYFGDTAKIYYSIDPNASKHGYYKGRQNDTAYRKIPMSFSQMIGYSKNERNRPSEVNAKIREIQILDLQSKIASVKLRAWWGIDYLLLTKMDDRWIIEKVLWQSL
ncbi:MAG TPA: nuclear transport factor 2 family protein [Flavisolibacter sp.]|nr:nuclear transport factor 2 family protein [Flavisolibacter sp.]